MGVVVRAFLQDFRSVAGPLGIVLGCGVLAGCSADVTRFDFASLSPTSAGGGSGFSSPSEPVYAGTPPAARTVSPEEETRRLAFGKGDNGQDLPPLTPDMLIPATPQRRTARSPLPDTGSSVVPTFGDDSSRQPAPSSSAGAAYQPRTIQPAPRVTVAPPSLCPVRQARSCRRVRVCRLRQRRPRATVPV